MNRRLEIEVGNPQQPHVATVLVLDVSGSMDGANIRELNDGIASFKEEIEGDDLASKRVDLAVVTFGDSVSVANDFTGVDGFEPPHLQASGYTPMGEAVLKSLEMVEDRKQQYKQQGIDYYRPWVFLITDGAPTDMNPGDGMWSRVIDAVHKGEASKKFMFFAVGVDSADMEVLKQIAPPQRPPVHLKRGKFKEMFEWLSKSQQTVSGSNPGEQVALENPTAPGGWGEISV